MTNQADFKKLQAKWYQKLEKSGFEDIEQDENNLKRWDAHRVPYRHTEETFKAKEEYYRLAGQFLHDHPFESSFEKHVWELHSQGVSIRQIVIALKKRKVKAYRFLVHSTIVKLSKLMGKQCP